MSSLSHEIVQSEGPLTDAELRASPVPVTTTPSGVQDVNVVSSVSLTVTGPLTNTELRAAPVTTTSVAGNLSNGVQISVTQAATQLVAANANRKKLIIQVIGNAVIRLGTTGVTNTTGLQMRQFDTIIFDAPNCPTNDIYAVRENNGSVLVLVQEIV